MSTAIPVLRSDRLVIRPFVLQDLEAIHDVLSRTWADPPESFVTGLLERRRWLRWTVAAYRELAALNQPPYGDRAITSKETGRIVGSVGLTPSLGPFGQLPEFPGHGGSPYVFPEVGLFWAVDPAHQGQGYATEAGSVLADYAFAHMNLGRIVATTEYANGPSIAVMRKMGMKIFRNPKPEPVWFQIVGLLERA